MNTFIEAIDNDIKNLLTRKTTLVKSNLSFQKKEALKKLANRDYLIFSKADKGGATVIQDVNNYIKVATRQLEYINFYEKLTINPTLESNIKINTVIYNFKKQDQKSSKLIEMRKSKNTKVLHITETS